MFDGKVTAEAAERASPAAASSSANRHQRP